MKRSGAWLTRYALENIGVTHTFGIPGEHNSEIYQQLEESDFITPCLVTHEASAAYMADAVSRTTDSIGTLMIVPASGITNAASGIGEAYLAGIPMLIITGGVDRAKKHYFQRQDIDHQALLAPITKAAFLIDNHSDIVTTIFEAYTTATSGEPGPVFVEIPINLQLCIEETGELPIFKQVQRETKLQPIDDDAVNQAAEMLLKAENPCIFVGWGAKNAYKQLQSLASLIAAPVATTLQGLSVFPGSHPLHTGMGFGPCSVPAAQNAFEQCDCLLAIATRFSETSTGNFGIEPPEKLIHMDINPEVFDTNYPAAIKLQGDATLLINALLEKITALQPTPRKNEALIKQIATDKHGYLSQWRKHKTNRVNPANFFSALKKQLPANAFVACDDGNHTMLTAELLPINQVAGFISPSDFNAAGFCVPAVNALKLAHPGKCVIGIVGDGAMLMSGMEAITASKYKLGVIYFLFNDGELSQVAQTQDSTLKYGYTKLEEADWIAFSQAVGCEYVGLEDDDQIQTALDTAFQLTLENKPVLVDVHIDYSKQTAFMEGVLKTRFKRSGTGTKARYLARALTRKLIGN